MEQIWDFSDQIQYILAHRALPDLSHLDPIWPNLDAPWWVDGEIEQPGHVLEMASLDITSARFAPEVGQIGSK